MTQPARGPLLIVSGPSGSGKTTLVRHLLDSGRWPLRHSISATTRQPRTGERHGVDYYFWSPAEFADALARDEFLEHATVHGNSYGTLAREVEPYRAEGQGVILDIDTQGARQVRERVPDHVSVFVLTSSLDAYEVRLRARGTESEEAIQRRLMNARLELSQRDQYHYQILNDRLEDAVAALSSIVDGLFGGNPCLKI